MRQHPDETGNIILKVIIMKKKIIFLAVFVLLITVGLTSCNSNTGSNELLGTWQREETSGGVVHGYKIIVDEYMVELAHAYGAYNYERIGLYQYNISGNTLYLTGISGFEGDNRTYSYSVSGSNLTLTGSDSDFSGTYTKSN